VCFYWSIVVRPDRFELPTFWFVARRSIQLSYGRLLVDYFSTLANFGVDSQLAEETDAGAPPVA
jgi:hypothetical protein